MILRFDNSILAAKIAGSIVGFYPVFSFGQAEIIRNEIAGNIPAPIGRFINFIIAKGFFSRFPSIEAYFDHPSFPTFLHHFDGNH
ncbi:hypothetical protein [Bacillus sp. REN3]|uniref:hypothetical protein n=1 Tax=Bacillus sp. REN3 TaxID=2802440 RepID=UPI001AED125B|nr:hypothetical protein [Bacillus sp. REN3]